MVRRSVLYFLASLPLGIAAGAVGAATDVDFFNPADFYDRTELHHEHLVVLVAGLALLILIAAGVAYLRNSACSPPIGTRETGERV